MRGPHLIVNARETQPNLYAKAEELYLVVYPQQMVPSPGVPPITLPSGYQPQCNPCFHPGLPAPFVFHDHVISGAPGNGNNGTAGEFKAPWKVILLIYNPAYVSSRAMLHYRCSNIPRLPLPTPAPPRRHLVELRAQCHPSERSALIGSTRTARRAGTYVATPITPP